MKAAHNRKPSFKKNFELEINIQNQVINELREENKKLKETLSFYAEHHTYNYQILEIISPIWEDKGQKARNALYVPFKE